MRPWGLLLLCLGVSTPACAQALLESYVARLSANDHFNSQGERLTSPALIIRQDRANVYKFGRQDGEDEEDKFFRNAQNRELLQQFLERGRTTRAAYQAIVNGQPLIRVNIYRMGHSAYVDVLLLHE
jgi:hypothetical protein